MTDATRLGAPITHDEHEDWDDDSWLPGLWSGWRWPAAAGAVAAALAHLPVMADHVAACCVVAARRSPAA